MRCQLLHLHGLVAAHLEGAHSTAGAGPNQAPRYPRYSRICDFIGSMTLEQATFCG